jgi:GNAT superfamily N-acetyltransferase
VTTDGDFELVTIGGPEDEALLDAFHAGVYLDAFAHQREPVEAWKQALWGESAAHAMTVRIARRGDAIAGGIAFERYPRSGCGLMTYLVVGAEARGVGLGRRLLDDAVAALRGAGAPYVLGEVSVPDDAEGRDRLARFQRWGARVLDCAYVQPALGPGLARDHHLRLIAFGAPGGHARGAVIREFIAELYEATEGAADRDVLAAIPDEIALVTL